MELGWSLLYCAVVQAGIVLSIVDSLWMCFAVDKVNSWSTWQRAVCPDPGVATRLPNIHQGVNCVHEHLFQPSRL